MATENIVMQETNEDPQLLAMASVAATKYNVDNVSKLVVGVGHYKERMSQMKETLRKERGEGQELKRKHVDTFSNFERLKRAYKVLESEKDALILSVAITEGEKRDLESKISELEMQKDTTNKRIEELETQNSLLEKQIKLENEKQPDITPFCSQACLLQRKIN